MKEYSPLKVLIRLLSISKKYTAWFVFLCLIALLHSFVSLLIVEVYKRMVNSAVQADLSQLWDTVQLAMITIVALVLLSFINVYFSARLHNQSTLKLQSYFLNKTLRLRWPQVNLFHSSDLVNRMNESTEAAQSGVNEKLVKLLGDLAQVCFMIAYLTFIDWRITLGVIVIAVILPIVLAQVSSKLRRIYDYQQHLRSERDAIIQNAVQGAEIVRTLGIHEKIGEIYADLYRTIIAYSKKALFLEGMIRQGNYIVPFFSMVFVLGYGGYLTINGAIDIGSLVAFVVAIDWIVVPLNGLANVWAEFQNAISHGKRVFELERISEEDTTTSHQELTDRTLPYLKEDFQIQFNNVAFGYTSDLKILERVDFTIRSGTITGIVGASGSGKSTLLKMLLRLIEPVEGSITYNDKGISEIPLDCWRERIAYISQRTFLFSGTIMDNIKVGHLDASEEEVMEAARKANIHDVIMRTANGYHTLISENGNTFSGGERQRLSLARAFLKNPELLILDEPTASLDHVNEALIMNSLRTLMHGKTTVIVTHELSIIKDADTTLRFMDGHLQTLVEV